MIVCGGVLGLCGGVSKCVCVYVRGCACVCVIFLLLLIIERRLKAFEHAFVLTLHLTRPSTPRPP